MYSSRSKIRDSKVPEANYSRLEQPQRDGAGSKYVLVYELYFSDQPSKPLRTIALRAGLAAFWFALSAGTEIQDTVQIRCVEVPSLRFKGSLYTIKKLPDSKNRRKLNANIIFYSTYIIHTCVHVYNSGGRQQTSSSAQSSTVSCRRPSKRFAISSTCHFCITIHAIIQLGKLSLNIGAQKDLPNGNQEDLFFAALRP